MADRIRLCESPHALARRQPTLGMGGVTSSSVTAHRKHGLDERVLSLRIIDDALVPTGENHVPRLYAEGASLPEPMTGNHWSFGNG